MGRRRWGLAVAGVVALTAVIGGLTVATGCVSVASACPGEGLGIQDAAGASSFDASLPTLDEVAPGQRIALVGYGFGRCSENGAAFCSQNGRVDGPREVAIVWRQTGGPDVTVAEARIEDGGSFVVAATVPEAAVAGHARVLLLRDGGVAVETDVEVAG